MSLRDNGDDLHVVHMPSLAEDMGRIDGLQTPPGRDPLLHQLQTLRAQLVTARRQRDQHEERARRGERANEALRRHIEELEAAIFEPNLEVTAEWTEVEL